MKRNQTLESKIDRLLSIEEIRQLVAKYCLALDMRDLDAMCGLFPEDISVGKEEKGRNSLKRWFDDTLRNQFSGTAHFTGNHIIEFDDPDHAHGIVYSRNEHETGGEWIIMTMMYFDKYERIDERWYFRRRLPLYWYATDINKPPIGDRKMRWPGREPYEGGWHDFWPTYARFWSKEYDKSSDVEEPVPIDHFLRRMKPDDKPFSVRVR